MYVKFNVNGERERERERESERDLVLKRIFYFLIFLMLASHQGALFSYSIQFYHITKV